MNRSHQISVQLITALKMARLYFGGIEELFKIFYFTFRFLPWLPLKPLFNLNQSLQIDARYWQTTQDNQDTPLLFFFFTAFSVREVWTVISWSSFVWHHTTSYHCPQLYLFDCASFLSWQTGCLRFLLQPAGVVVSVAVWWAHFTWPLITLDLNGIVQK